MFISNGPPTPKQKHLRYSKIFLRPRLSPIDHILRQEVYLWDRVILVPRAGTKSFWFLELGPSIYFDIPPPTIEKETYLIKMYTTDLPFN